MDMASCCRALDAGALGVPPVYEQPTPTQKRSPHLSWLMTKPNGQWSEPVKSGKMKESWHFSDKSLETRK